MSDSFDQPDELCEVFDHDGYETAELRTAPESAVQASFSSAARAERQTVRLVGWMLSSHHNWATFRDMKAAALSDAPATAEACASLSRSLSAATGDGIGVRADPSVLARFLEIPEDTTIEPTSSRSNWSLCPNGLPPTYYAMERNPAVYQKFLQDPEYIDSFIEAVTHESINKHSKIDEWMKFPLQLNQYRKDALGNEIERLSDIAVVEDMFKKGKTSAAMDIALSSMRDRGIINPQLVDGLIAALHPCVRLDEEHLRSFYSSRRSGGSLLRTVLASPFYQNSEDILRTVCPQVV